MTWEQIVAFLKAQGIKDVPVDLTDPRLTPAKLEEYRAAFKAKYAEVRAAGAPLADLKQLSDAVKSVEAEQVNRTALAELDATMTDPETPPGDEGDEGDGAEDKSVAGQSSGTEDLEPEKTLIVPDATTGDGTLTDDDKRAKELATAAAAALAGAGSSQTEGERTGGTGDGETPAPLVAAATLGGVEFGQPVDSNKMGRIAEEVISSMVAGQSSLREGSPERRVQVASMLAYGDRPAHDDALVLSENKTPKMNTDIIRKALADHTAAVKAGAPMTAATFCPPFDVIREIPDSTDTSSPLRDSLPFVPFGHGGFTFNAGVQFVDVAGAVDIWTETEQDAVNPDVSATWKPCYEIICPTPTTLRADDWITACVSWKVGMDINNPENVADVFKKVEGQRARRTEQYLLTMVDPLLTNYRYNTTPLQASIPDFVAALVASFEHAGYNSRLRGDISYTMYLDTGMLGNLVVDRARAAFGLGRESESVMGYLRSVIAEAQLPIDRIVQLKERNPSTTSAAKGFNWGVVGTNGHPYSSSTYPVAANGTMVDGPDVLSRFRVRVLPTSEVFAFGTGEIRTGIRQDFAMARQNKVGWFVEEAIKLGKFGVSPWFALNLELCPTGARSGWVDPNDLGCGTALGS